MIRRMLKVIKMQSLTITKKIKFRATIQTQDKTVITENAVLRAVYVAFHALIYAVKNKRDKVTAFVAVIDEKCQ
ncbi:UNKNOWN [Stylonychia lemnae]|uniref:Uncharacterized protein n=1 Tax=Stylonychia lemnae TaxID=5949 RepID=A0A078AQJ1_STYLE|nr:UNKNOWN [Stylonychia lemnae]|eukprot:CDW84211.1 UNKNOWN [Stylonychia lemnae]